MLSGCVTHPSFQGMGGQQSKEAQSIVFYSNEPDISIQFTPNLVNQLNGGQSNAGDEDTDRTVEERLQQQLSLEKERRYAFEQRSVAMVSREADDISRRLGPIPALAVDSASVPTQQSVIECYRKNSKRPLDCWKEVEEFKDTVLQAQTSRIIS
ncbi:hypothetical protein BJ742DRAFT_783411 [Cladochytrium replicatum]|nr:hypothetical protein BJ742DRAFT_783411 [Cladochytrium replicatum]